MLKDFQNWKVLVVKLIFLFNIFIYKMTKNNLSKYFEYFKANFIILFKKLIEYKANFFVCFIEHIIYFSSIVLIFNIIFSNFADVISWKLSDYVLFFVLIDWICASTGIFIWRMPDLRNIIIKGDFNIFFLRPINRFISYFLHNLNGNTLIYTIINPIIHITTLIIFFDIELHNILFGVLIWILVWIGYISLYEFLHSFEFIYKSSSRTMNEVFNELNYSLANQYPYQFFNKLNFKTILLIISPLFFVGSLLIPILRNYPIWNLRLQIFILILSIIIFIIGIIINWKIGLKKYEAYG